MLSFLTLGHLVAFVAGAVTVVESQRAYTWVKTKIVAPATAVAPTVQSDISKVVDDAVAKIEAAIKKV